MFKEPTLRQHTLLNGSAHGPASGATQVHREAASTSPLAALAALQVLQWGMLRTAVDDGVPASPASLHGSSPSSLVFSSLQLRCGGAHPVRSFSAENDPEPD